MRNITYTSTKVQCVNATYIHHLLVLILVAIRSSTMCGLSVAQKGERKIGTTPAHCGGVVPTLRKIGAVNVVALVLTD